MSLTNKYFFICNLSPPLATVSFLSIAETDVYKKVNVWTNDIAPVFTDHFFLYLLIPVLENATGVFEYQKNNIPSFLSQPSETIVAL